MIRAQLDIIIAPPGHSTCAETPVFCIQGVLCQSNALEMAKVARGSQYASLIKIWGVNLSL